MIGACVRHRKTVDRCSLKKDKDKSESSRHHCQSYEFGLPALSRSVSMEVQKMALLLLLMNRLSLKGRVVPHR